MNIDLDPAFYRHPKTRRLRRLLGREGLYVPTAIWCWVAELRRTERTLEGMDALDIADAIDWPEDDAERLIGVLVECGFLDRDQDGGLSIHDWMDWSGQTIAHCQSEAQRKRQVRAMAFSGTKTSSRHPADVRQTSGGRPADIQRTSSGCPAPPVRSGPVRSDPEKQKKDPDQTRDPTQSVHIPPTAYAAPSPEMLAHLPEPEPEPVAESSPSPALRLTSGPESRRKTPARVESRNGDNRDDDRETHSRPLPVDNSDLIAAPLPRTRSPPTALASPERLAAAKAAIARFIEDRSFGGRF